ncbi:MAG: transaldolase [Acidimicrobiales bacterium]
MTTTKLHRLYDEFVQSPWLDNLKRGWITGGELERWVERGVRGVTSNPTIFQKAIAGGHDYDDQFRDLVTGGASVEASYWELVKADIEEALRILRPVYDSSNGVDGFVSVELAPDLARDSEGSTNAARLLHDQIDEPNVFVKIPGTAEGVPAIRQMISEGRSINVTLLFGLTRYAEVIEAYVSGLELLRDSGHDIDRVRSVASFFVSRVDTEVDRRLEEIGTEPALALRGKAAVANAQLAYQLFVDRFRGERWEGLAAGGAQVQRPLWASTSTKNPAYPETLYVDTLIGPDTVNTMPETTLEDVEAHGTLGRTVDAGLGAARRAIDDLAALGIDMEDVASTLEDEGVATFAKSYDELLTTLETKATELDGGQRS